MHSYHMECFFYPDAAVVYYPLMSKRRIKSLTGVSSFLGRQFLIYGIMFMGKIVLGRNLLPPSAKRDYGIDPGCLEHIPLQPFLKLM
jgi:hypothetical protein